MNPHRSFFSPSLQTIRARLSVAHTNRFFSPRLNLAEEFLNFLKLLPILRTPTAFLPDRSALDRTSSISRPNLFTASSAALFPTISTLIPIVIPTLAPAPDPRFAFLSVLLASSKRSTYIGLDNISLDFLESRLVFGSCVDSRRASTTLYRSLASRWRDWRVSFSSRKMLGVKTIARFRNVILFFSLFAATSQRNRKRNLKVKSRIPFKFFSTTSSISLNRFSLDILRRMGYKPKLSRGSGISRRKSFMRPATA
mmetsp:Transcript_6626/g.10235  ORF Transcript_6626/g.10235 Transcript_6626/m.10235 type:complete len:254 (-) Transcript_6626:1336-2097(-)